MEKIISEVKRKRQERNAAIINEFVQYMKNGSDKTATYQFLADKYGLKPPHVYQIVKEVQY